MQLLRQVAGASAQVDRRPRRLHLRRVHRALQRDHRRRALQERRREPAAAEHPEAQRDQSHPQPVCDRSGAGEKVARGRGLQPLQARQRRRQLRRSRAAEVEHLARRSDRLGQDLSRADAGEDSRRSAGDGRCDLADRSRLRRRRRREHSAQAHPSRRLRRQAGREGHRLHRRDRQDRAQEREPLDHARRLGRRRAAGAAQDSRRHDGQRSAAGRAQASAPRVHPDRHHQRAVHLRRRVRRPRADHRGPRGLELARLPRQSRSRRKSRSRARCCSS